LIKKRSKGEKRPMFNLMQNGLLEVAEMRQAEMHAEAQRARLLHSREASERFRWVFFWGRLRWLWARLTGRSIALQRLERSPNHQQRYTGVQTVPIHLIQGSEGRSTDFDRDFYPLSAHTRERWLGIYDAQNAGEELPPVELIRLNERYFVRDGHHRISVARTLGRVYVDATVISAN
jgi:hypothetical protein